MTAAAPAVRRRWRRFSLSERILRSCFYLLTVLAVLLSIRRESMFIALLGLLGGFATPALLSTGENRPISLFTYLLLLNIGLAWVAYKKRWPLLSAFSLTFTVFYQWGWTVKFLSAQGFPVGEVVMDQPGTRDETGCSGDPLGSACKWTYVHFDQPNDQPPMRRIYFQIGALGPFFMDDLQVCADVTPTLRTSWGSVKAIYR